MFRLVNFFSPFVLRLPFFLPQRCDFSFCTEPECHQIIVGADGIAAISALLQHDSSKIVENAIATLLQLDTIEIHSSIFSTSNQSIARNCQNSTHTTLRNLATIFLEEATKK